MTKKASIAKAGKLISVESGAYSDYSVAGFFVVLRDFDPFHEAQNYLEKHPEQKENYCFEKSEYLASLIAQGLLLEIEYGVLHVDCYGSIGDFSFTP